MLYRTIETRAEKVNDRVFRFTISDESLDRYNTVLKSDGWRTDNYSRNPIVAYQHMTWGTNPDLIIAKSTVWVENKSLMSEAEFEPIGDNEIADKIVKKLNFGSLCATSVGFDPLHWSYGDKEVGEDPDVLYFRKNDLLEWSVVNIPANANATIQKSLADFIVKASRDNGRTLTPEQQYLLGHALTQDPIPTTKDLQAIMSGELKPEAPAKPVGPDPYRTKFLNQLFKSVS